MRLVRSSRVSFSFNFVITSTSDFEEDPLIIFVIIFLASDFVSFDSRLEMGVPIKSFDENPTNSSVFLLISKIFPVLSVIRAAHGSWCMVMGIFFIGMRIILTKKLTKNREYVSS